LQPGRGVTAKLKVGVHRVVAVVVCLRVLAAAHRGLESARIGRSGLLPRTDAAEYMGRHVQRVRRRRRNASVAHRGKVHHAGSRSGSRSMPHLTRV
jgi:hypothetical protein